jgi:hypothetical protein
MRVSDLHRRILAGQKYAFLLDDYPNAAAAYSLRKLRSAYTGNCIEVRRSSDNTTQNIGFVNNVLDTASLLSFVGAGNGFVRTWYDQSGSNRNTNQTTNSLQPKIITNGSLSIINSKPSILFDDNYRINFSNSISTTNSTYTAILIANAVSSPTSSKVIIGSNFGGLQIGYSNLNLSILKSNVAVLLNTAIPSFSQYLSFVKTNTSGVFVNINSTISNQSLTNPSLTGSINSIGINPANNAEFYRGNIQEIIIYTTDQSTNRNAIETNINTHYNIY